MIDNTSTNEHNNQAIDHLGIKMKRMYTSTHPRFEFDFFLDKSDHLKSPIFVARND